MISERMEPLDRLKRTLQQLPGIGARTAERLAYHILREPRDFAAALSQSILDVKDRLTNCEVCCNLTETSPCCICSNPSRDASEVWVVEQPRDLLTLESTGLIRGVYHVLLGRIAPLEGVEPEHLTIEALTNRVRSGGVREIILALNPTVDGDSTALYLQQQLSALCVNISRPARGLAVGTHIEFASAGMLEAAIRGRTSL